MTVLAQVSVLTHVTVLSLVEVLTQVILLKVLTVLAMLTVLRKNSPAALPPSGWEGGEMRSEKTIVHLEEFIELEGVVDIIFRDFSHSQQQLLL